MIDKNKRFIYEIRFSLLLDKMAVLKNFHLEEDLIEELKERAAIEDRSQSSIVRRAIKKYLEVKNAEPKE